ncbi:phage shock protein A [Bacillus mesophilus]|uniref:PspA/IM30 family protein n=1 Tax=Bacillus mesophilus TaxID=1808955 RepID=A0A6M0QDM3_9BACI|nr:PspA/IM30 family protein [Bacillus mesophilus]MBM7662986.1 phage shock protein A [Bacillus mesophilus]NEY73690.1 PspA/IM30 family protein [Bacillus mesophilus]
MTNIFKRIKDSVSSDLHELMDEKEEKNPIAKLNQYLRQSEQETEKVRKLVERQYKLKEEFQKEYTLAFEMANKRKHQAEVAQKAGEETLYTFAMREFEEYQTRSSRMKEMLDEANAQLTELEQKYEEMKHRLKDMQLRRMELMGRENVARANFQINHVMSQTADQPYSRFNEIDQYIKNLEHKVNSAYYRNSFDSKIAKLENELKEKAKATAI